jgi:hypothetical protein
MDPENFIVGKIFDIAIPQDPPLRLDLPKSLHPYRKFGKVKADQIIGS